MLIDQFYLDKVDQLSKAYNIKNHRYEYRKNRIYYVDGTI